MNNYTVYLFSVTFNILSPLKTKYERFYLHPWAHPHFTADKTNVLKSQVKAVAQWLNTCPIIIRLRVQALNLGRKTVKSKGC